MLHSKCAHHYKRAEFSRMGDNLEIAVRADGQLHRTPTGFQRFLGAYGHVLRRPAARRCCRCAGSFTSSATWTGPGRAS